MEIGTGIFCGAAFLGFVYLFVKTREIWNWKKITVWSFGTPIILTLLVVGYFYISDAWQNRLQVVTSLKGIALGEKLSDVFFKHEGFVPSPRILYDKGKEGEKVRIVTMPDGVQAQFPLDVKDEEIRTVILRYFPFLDSESADSRTRIYAKDKKVVGVSYLCNWEVYSGYTQVNGIRCEDNGEDVQKKYGQSLRVLCAKNDNFRVYDAVDL